jgi:hypothetical protein
MARELQLLAKEFDRQPVTVLRTNLNLYQTPISQAAASFLREIAAQAKKEKSTVVTLVAVIREPV